jgi:hypothetical protein
MKLHDIAEAMTMREVARLARVHLATVYRWAIHGVGGRKLRTVRKGGRRMALPEDCDEFFGGPHEATPIDNPTSDTVAHARAVAAIRDAGLLGGSEPEGTQR